jgi:dCMP deaminase
MEEKKMNDYDKWDGRFIELANVVSSWSKDPSTQVGAVIVNSDKIVVGLGYNGFARGVADLSSLYEDRTKKYEMIIHAEVNAILNATQSVKGCTLYCTHPPCSRCMAVIIQSGIVQVVSNKASEEFIERFKDSIALTVFQANTANVLLREHKVSNYVY